MAQLIDYETNETIREATADEARESAEAATRDGGAGVIRVDGVRCYVPEESPLMSIEEVYAALAEDIVELAAIVESEVQS